MNTFDILLIEFVIVLCPMLLYFIYLVFTKTVDIKKNNLILDLSLVSSFYLLNRLSVLYEFKIPVIFLDALLIISYLKKREYLSIILSILLIIYYKNNFNINIIYLILEYLLFYILYNTNLINKKYLFSNIIIFFIGIMYIIYFKEKIIIPIILLYIIINLIIYLFIKMESVMNLFKDITDIEKEKRIVESLFKITHEIKNPIAVCKGYLDMYDVSNIEHSKKYIPIIKSEINRTLTLLEDYLSISKIKINKDIMDVNMLLEDTISSLKPIINNKNVAVSYNISDDEIIINGDYNRLKQTLINIIKNSIESISKKGEIKISTLINRKHIDIIIEDNGIGIKKEDLVKIKEAFFTTKERGTGLGIFLSNEIIKEHNGMLLYSSKENIGTKVTIRLPLI